MKKLGKLEVFPTVANLPRTKPQDAQKDCYVQVTANDSTYKSQVCKGRGVNPVWSDVINVPITPDVGVMEIAVMDKGFLSGTKVGSASIPLAEVYQQGAVDKNVPLMLNNAQVGSLRFGMNYVEPGRRTPTLSPMRAGVMGAPGVPVTSGRTPVGPIPVTAPMEFGTVPPPLVPAPSGAPDININTPLPGPDIPVGKASSVPGDPGRLSFGSAAGLSRPDSIASNYAGVGGATSSDVTPPLAPDPSE